MSSLYIGGAQCVHADFLNGDDCEQYDSQEKEMAKLAKDFDVTISRYCLDEDDYSFVIMNKSASHECFYAGAAFDVDMSVETSDTFEARAQEFIKSLNEKEEFKTFHNLSWSKPKVLYFVSS